MKTRAPRNQTLTCNPDELAQLARYLVTLNKNIDIESITNRIINQDALSAIPFLPNTFIDLLVIDPPYNLTKNYNGQVFRSQGAEQYSEWFDNLICSLLPKLNRRCSVYVCSDWQTSTLMFPILDKHFTVRNRITWERDKGRGAKTNWKNNAEDIWFCTMGDEYYFDVDAVKLKRRVIAPYKNSEGLPKDWDQTQEGNYRLTHPSNMWSDISIPFWSMPENTDHPTQKPEKLISKLILASSKKNDFVFDPFLGSGTTAVVAKKLERRFCGIEIDSEYCCWVLKRLIRAEYNTKIQGYANGVFWERNSLNEQKPNRLNDSTSQQTHTEYLFQ